MVVNSTFLKTFDCKINFLQQNYYFINILQVTMLSKYQELPLCIALYIVWYI